MKDLKALNLEKYVGCRISSSRISNALVVGYNAKLNFLILSDADYGWGQADLDASDKILLDTAESGLWYLPVGLVKEAHTKEALRDMVGLDVMYQGKPRRCVGYNEGLNSAILQKNGGWVKFSKGDVIGVREDLDAGFEYADYNEVEVL